MRSKIRRAIGLAGVAAALLTTAAPAHARLFVITSTGNANADLGFQRAAAYWQGIFVDPITVNITAGFSDLGCVQGGGCYLGTSGSHHLTTNFAAAKAALSADATSAADALMVAGLPGGDTYSKYMNRTLTNSADHVEWGVSAMRMTQANAKAMGLLAGNGTAEDAQINFTNRFSWDFDPSDGIGAGMFDFVGIAIHELGHAMGFTTGVDTLDGNSGTDAYFDPYTTMLDFTRCSRASEDAGADIDGRTGTAAKDFAIDGACTALVSDAWSTGRIFGDGYQASHWKDQNGIGIMDPTLEAQGILNVATDFDTLALDVIGWTTRASQQQVPEPSSLLLVGAGLLGLMRVRRSRKAT